MSEPITTEPIASEEVIPHQPGIPFLQKWRSFGTGIGIEIRPEALFITLTVVRPQGIKVLDSLEIPRYRERPAAEWGEDYQSFLKKHRIPHVSAVVVLPSQDCISRAIGLPGVADRELAAAVQYQLDGLHPYSEEEATHSFARLKEPRQSFVSVAIAKRPVIEDYATLFDEAGVAVAGFLTPATAIYSAMRVLQLPPAGQYLAIHEDGSGLQLYGESDTHAIYFVRFPDASERAIGAAAAQMRLPEQAPQARLASLLPVAEMVEATGPMAYAASLVSALPSQSLAVNLLPVERRKTSSPLRWVPTIVLVVLLMLLGTGFAYYQDFENRRLLERLDSEIARLQPRVTSVRNLDTEIEAINKRISYLAMVASYPQEDLDTLRELTRIMPMSSYVSRLDMTRKEVVMAGEFDQAMELLKLLDSSPYFKDSEFTAAPGRSPDGKEIFQIRTTRETPAQAKPVIANPPVPRPQQPISSTPLPAIAPPPPLPGQGPRP